MIRLDSKIVAKQHRLANFEIGDALIPKLLEMTCYEYFTDSKTGTTRLINPVLLLSLCHFPP